MSVEIMDPIRKSVLVTPHGGILKDLNSVRLATASDQQFGRRPSVALDHRQRCDLELLLNGAFSPLEGFMTFDDYSHVVHRMRLSNGLLWPMPITLDVSEEAAERLSIGQAISLTDGQGTPVAEMLLEDIYRPDKRAEAQHVFGTVDPDHPGVAELLRRGTVYLGGPLRGAREPTHNDFIDLRSSPRRLRDWFTQMGWERIVGFQTRNPMHRAHFELTRRACEFIDGRLLLHPVVGHTKEGDVDAHTRVRCYRALLPYYPEGQVKLNVLPLAMRMAGPREAMWHALVRKNYGVSHFIVGRDHAGPGSDRTGRPYYGPRDAQELLEQHKDELGIHIMPFSAMMFSQVRTQFVPSDRLQEGEDVADVSGTELRQHLRAGTPIPSWFTFPEVETILRQRFPTGAKRGCAIFFTGLSGAGKSAIAQALMAQILEETGRPVTMLDGDEIRRTLSAGLGFSKADRSANVRRIAFVAAEVVRHGGVVICAPIAPYADDRAEARRLTEAFGDFIEVHVSTAIEVCEKRDTKGLYAEARKGLIKEFTGVSDPYELPIRPDFRLDGATKTPSLHASIILEDLLRRWRSH
ncbi:bifunctional sulfate adenylyltransferase/adenylylsulfate kinase [Luteibacter sp.]|uniref:bifunctional sulfate adenylyltransferase/adenylylsulfate kinase n=1 Tax=Luteibacter sp. TaxID=1886636 RepID=UPI003F7DCDF9